MPSQFFGLNIAYTGLTASNAALNTTANNISNTETEGYSRQHVVQEAADALRTFTTYGCAGAGVDVLAIERIRDEFYDNKYWDTNTSAGQYNMKQYYMHQIEDYFADTESTQGFGTIFNKMMDTLAEVKKQSGLVSTKAQFMGYASNLAEYFNNMANNLELVQKDINSEIKVKIDEINSIASELATLNKQINVIEMSGGAANELRDKRTLLLDGVSAIVDIEVKEFPITDTYNPERETGGNRFVVKMAGGQTLVDTNDYNTLTCIARTNKEKINQSDAEGLYDVYWISDLRTGTIGEQFNLYNPLLGGELQGLVEMRDGNNGEYFNGTVTNVVNAGIGATGTDVEGHSLKTVTIAVDDVYLTDLNKSMMSDFGGRITINNTVYYYTDWTYNYDAATGKTTYDLTIDETKSGVQISTDAVDKDAAIGKDIKYQGVPYYQQQMNEWLRVFAQGFNDILTGGYDVYGGNGHILFTGNKETDDTQYEFGTRYSKVDPDTGERVDESIHMDDDSYYRLTAKNVSVLDVVWADPDLLATKTDPTAGVDEYGNITKLINMTTDKNAASFRGAPTSDFLVCILADVALNANSANTFYNTYHNVGQSIDNQRLSISGVDKDEEAVSLVKYQNAYNLASRMIQTLTEIYDRLILQTGV